MRNVARLPIVAVDLYGDECGVAYFPPMENNKDDKKKKDGGGSNGFSVEGMGNEEMMEMMKAMARLKKGVQARSIGGLNGRVGANVILKREDDASYKAVRRHLSKGMGHGVVLQDALVLDGKMHNDNDDDGDEEDVIVLPRPHLLMGARSTNDLSPAARAAFESLLPKGSGKGGKKSSKKSAPTSSIIDQEQSTAPLSLTTIAMDGNTSPKGDDYDRVAFQMRLNSKKKLMTILPDEAVGIVIAQARKSVRDGYLKEHPESELNTAESGGGDNGGEDDDTFMDYPPAFAIPGWATMDKTLEALIDAAGGSSSACGPSLHQRSIAACVGALLPPPASAANSTQQQPQAATKLVKLCMEAMQTKDAEAAKEAGVQAALNKTEPVEPEPYIPLVILVGATNEGIEITAVQLSKPQTPNKELHCPFGNISIISSVCCLHKDPLSMLELTLDQLRSQVGLIVPESEEPTAIVTYGTIGMQLKLSTKLKSALTKYGKDGKNNDDWDGWDQDIPLVSTKEECVSMGLAVLAASVHGRVRLIVQVKGTDGKMRPKARLGVSVQDVATSAVAISFNYFGGKEEKWTDPKVIFDFDRRVPAGPYRIDFTAAECAAHVRHCKRDDKNSPCCIEDESVLIEQAKSLEGSRGIPDREAAALQLRFRIFQKATRGGDDWIQVGDTMRPLSMKHSQKDEGESGTDDLVACESAVLEVSLNTVGLITTGFGSNG